MAKRKLPRSPAEPKALPQRADVWQVDVRRLDAPVDVQDMTVFRPWMVVVFSETDDRVLAMIVMPSAPTTEALWQAVVHAMTKPGGAKPHRPTEMQVRRLKKLLELKRRLTRLGVRMTVLRELPVIDQFVEEILEDLAGDDEPGLLDMPGVTPHQVKCLFEAAAGFYRQAPWKTAGRRLIEVRCPQLPGGPWHAISVGHKGTPPGLMLHDGLNAPQDGQAIESIPALAVRFGEKEDLPAADQEAVEVYRWKTAGKKAYPAIYRKELDGSVRAPVDWEQQLLEACLRTLPGFVQGLKVGKETVPTRLAVKLSWVP